MSGGNDFCVLFYVTVNQNDVIDFTFSGRAGPCLRAPMAALYVGPIGPIQSGCNPVESTLSTSSLNRITTTGEQLTSLTAADRAVLD